MVRSGLHLAGLVGFVLFGCTGDAGPTGPEGPAGPEGPQGPAAIPTTVEVSPSSLTLSDGGSEQLTAVVRAQDGAVMHGVAVTWTSDNSSVAALSPVAGATVDPNKVVVTGGGHGTATVTAGVGSAASGTSSVLCCFPVSPSAFFSVRSGSTINPIGSPGIFDTGPDEAFLEFPLDFPTVSTVTIEFEVFDFIVGSNDPAIDFKVATYDANGAADATDFGRGVLLTTLTIQPGTRQGYALDVTSSVASLRATGATHIGLRFYESTLGQLAVQAGATLTGS
jgi:hypothetical protein